MGHYRRGEQSPPERDLSRYDLAGMGLRALAGQRLSFRQRRAGFVVLATDISEDQGVAAVWLARHPGARGSGQHILDFERVGGWRWRGAASGSARELQLMGRPSAAVNGPATMMTLLAGTASRSWADREKQPEGLELAGAGWVASAGFRLAAEARHLQAGSRMIPVPGHGYVIAAWRSPPVRARPAFAALGQDGARLSELGPDDTLDSLTWEDIHRTLGTGGP